MAPQNVETLYKILRRQADEIVRRRQVLLRRPSHGQSVHKIRVATRRVRQALRLLVEAAATRRAKRWLRRARGLGQALGDPRALDVSIAILRRRYARRHPTAVRQAAAGLADLRRGADERIVEALTDFKAKKFRRQIDQLLGSETGRLEKGWERLLRRAITGHARRLRRALSSEERMREELHDLRILVKKLRYRMEIADDMGHRSYGRPIGSLTRFQSLLGDWHDHQVLLEHLAQLRTPSDATARSRRTALFEDVSRHEKAAKERAVSELRSKVRSALS
ncbi:MAG: hypothetical protein MOGMAGMI_00074 [Candidatus Omnitrophica bacterium]|nr:hypothetical protein [Candidatus Omnitrophota bacterium]